MHLSLDPLVSTGNPKAAAAEEEDGEGTAQPEEQDPDRVITNARAARPEDGLLDAQALQALFQARTEAARTPSLRSAYDTWATFEPARTYGSRGDIAPGRRGHNEPFSSSYTHFWKSTLGDAALRPLSG